MFIYKKLIIGLVFILLNFQVQANLNTNEIVVDGISFFELRNAAKAIKDYSQVYLGPGIYLEGLHIKANDVVISGSKNTHFMGAIVKDKGTFIVSGDNVIIENIECSQVKSSSRNGSCIRQEGKNLTVIGVYFHDSEQGILQNPNAGRLTVKYSHFENLGKSGRAHGIYAQGDELIINNSTFLKSKDQGHEIKARSKYVVIENTVIASLTGHDSRLIDISNGGTLIIRNSILQQGNTTANRQAIGYGLEGTSIKRNNKIEITNSLFILEREKGNTLLALPKSRDGLHLKVSDNIIVGKVIDSKNYKEENTIYIDRSEANIVQHQLPDISTLPTLLNLLTEH